MVQAGSVGPIYYATALHQGAAPRQLEHSVVSLYWVRCEAPLVLLDRTYLVPRGLVSGACGNIRTHHVHHPYRDAPSL